MRSLVADSSQEFVRKAIFVIDIEDPRERFMRVEFPYLFIQTISLTISIHHRQSFVYF